VAPRHVRARRRRRVPARRRVRAEGRQDDPRVLDRRVRLARGGRGIGLPRRFDRRCRDQRRQAGRALECVREQLERGVLARRIDASRKGDQLRRARLQPNAPCSS
jgi:hypothetical protein